MNILNLAQATLDQGIDYASTALKELPTISQVAQTALHAIQSLPNTTTGRLILATTAGVATAAANFAWLRILNDPAITSQTEVVLSAAMGVAATVGLGVVTIIAPGHRQTTAHRATHLELPDRWQLSYNMTSRAEKIAHEALTKTAANPDLIHLAKIAASLAADVASKKPSADTEQVNRAALEAGFSVIHGITRDACPNLSRRIQPDKALLSIADPDDTSSCSPLTLEMAALKIQRAYINHLHQRAEKEEKIAAMKVESPLMKKIRRGKIAEHQRGDFDHLFYRYLNYAKKTGDIKSLQRLSFAFISAFTMNHRPNSDETYLELSLLLSLLFAKNKPSYCTAIVSLMIIIKNLCQSSLDHAHATQSFTWMNETFLANFSNLEGKNPDDPSLPVLENGLTKIDAFFPWIIRWTKEDPENVMHFEHGGGRYHLEEFFDGTSKGYPLEGITRRGWTYGHGIQVHPYGARDRETSIMYAQRSLLCFDDPCILIGDIQARWLQDCTNLSYEAGLRSEFIGHITDVRLEDVPEARAQDLLMFSRYLRKLITEGCEAAYFSRYGSSNLCARLAPLITI